MNVDPTASRTSDARFPAGWVALCTLVSAAWMARMVLGLGPVSESDEAEIALMARAIVRGEDLPAFYWGQSYMGSVEAWLAAPLFWLFGTSMPLLRALIASFTVLLVPVGAGLAWRGGGRRLACAAAATLACPPTLFAIWSAKPRGGFTDVIAFGVVVSWLFLRIADGATPRSQQLRALVAGVALGVVGWWNFFGLPFALPGVLVALLDRQTRRPSLWAMGVVGGLLGGSVLLVSNARNGWQTFAHALRPSPSQLQGGQPMNADSKRAWENLKNIGLPASLGIGDFRNEPRPLGRAGELLGAGALLGLLLSVVGAFRTRAVRPAIAALGPGLGAAVLALAFVFSRFGFETDPRYLLGLWPGLAWGWAWLLASIPARATPLSVGLGALLFGFQFDAVHRAQTPLQHWIWQRGGTPTLTMKPITDALLAQGIKGAYADYWTAERLTLDSDGAFISSDPTFTRHPPNLARLNALPRRCWISVPWGEAPRRIEERQAERVMEFAADPATGIGEALLVACAPEL